MDAAPTRCDVLVVGAGPAGSACAQMLARAGVDVALVDQQPFPRDKTCGDGLIPDAHAALKALGVFDQVMARAQPVAHVSCIGPRGGRIDVPGTMAVLPRRELDDILYRAALAAGTRALPAACFEAPIEDDAGRVVGANLATDDGPLRVQARWVVLATGAAMPPMQAAGLCDRRAPSGIALRGYVRNPAMAGRITTLQIVWHRRLAGGYGWVFPLPDGVFNIGAGFTGSYARRNQNLKQLFAAFCDVHADARELVAGGEWIGELKGAPLRCSLTGTRWSRPGLLATGEAVGSTYAFTGEGIGKAMATGMLAADAIVQQADDAAARAQYAAALRELKPRFDLYEKAEHVNRHPWLTDLVIWRANRSERIRRRMAGVLEETQNPGRLLSWRGITKLMFE